MGFAAGQRRREYANQAHAGKRFQAVFVVLVEQVHRSGFERKNFTGCHVLNLALPFDDAQFDVVSVAFGLRNLDDTARGLAEMARVTRPGGRVVILEFSPPARPRLAHRLFRLYFRHVLPRIGRLVSRHPTAYNYLPQSVEGFPHRGRLVEMMGETGLRVLMAKDLTAGIATLFIGEKP